MFKRILKKLCINQKGNQPNDNVEESATDKREEKLPPECASCTIYCYNQDNLKLGRNTKLNNAFLDLHARISIGDNVFFGHNVKILTGYHDISKFGLERQEAILSKEVNIDEGAWIASFAILLPGSNIGKHAVVAAGSVVHGNVEPNSVVAGNPAKIIKKINLNDKL